MWWNISFGCEYNFVCLEVFLDYGKNALKSIKNEKKIQKNKENKEIKCWNDSKSLAYCDSDNDKSSKYSSRLRRVEICASMCKSCKMSPLLKWFRRYYSQHIRSTLNMITTNFVELLLSFTYEYMIQMGILQQLSSFICSMLLFTLLCPKLYKMTLNALSLERGRECRKCR